MNDNNGQFHVTQDDFMRRDPAERDWLMFREFNLHRQACDQRFCKLERRKYWDKTVAMVSGAITAALVALGFQWKG